MFAAKQGFGNQAGDDPRFVAVASGGTLIATSPNGTRWVARTSLPVSAEWISVAYGAGLFVAVANDNDTIAATSPDGIIWTELTMPATAQWTYVAYLNNLFVALSFGTTAATSSDGITWTERTMPSSNNWRSVAYGNGIFLAIGPLDWAQSGDGQTWSTLTQPTGLNWSSVAWGQGRFVVSALGTNMVAVSFPNSLSFQTQTLPQTGNWTQVAFFGSGLFLVFGNNIGATGPYPSGQQWQQRAFPAGDWSSFAYNDELDINVTVALSSNTVLVGSGLLPGGPPAALPSSHDWTGVAST